MSFASWLYSMWSGSKPPTTEPEPPAKPKSDNKFHDDLTLCQELISDSRTYHRRVNASINIGYPRPKVAPMMDRICDAMEVHFAKKRAIEFIEDWQI